ncbi:hypothetical protein D3C75_1111870 [compost metagenome]
MCGQQVVASGFTRQIAANGVGFPEHEIAINQHRHHGVRVKFSKSVRFCRGKAAAVILLLIRQARFFAGPEHFAHVDGSGFAENIEHGTGVLWEGRSQHNTVVVAGGKGKFWWGWEPGHQCHTGHAASAYRTVWPTPFTALINQ